MRTISVLFTVAFVLMLSFGCLGPKYDSLNDIKYNPGKYLGEKVVINGTVKDSVKLGKISGFQLESGNGSIYISSDSLPAEGKTVVVQGTVMEEAIVGQYILAKQIDIKK
jgi:cytochrome c-type biogenesis protein CcmE